MEAVEDNDLYFCDPGAIEVQLNFYVLYSVVLRIMS
jgi:hypothetical protein